MLLKITLKCFSLRVILDLLNQVMNVIALRSFHHRIWHTGDVEIDVFVIHRKVELVRVITIFEITNFLHFVRASFHKFPRSIVTFQDAFFFLFHRLPRSIWRTKFSLRLTNNLLGHRFPRSIFNGFREFGWLGRTSLKCFSKWLLNRFPTGWCSTVEPVLIISFSPIEVVFQRDLWWWSMRQILSFIQLLSSFQSFNLNTIGWKCSLKNNCVRSCLIEH